MSNNMFTQFETDKNLEKNGIVLDYGDFRVTIARAGGANRKYNRTLEFVSKPYRRAIDNKTIAVEKAEEIMMQVATQSLVLLWEVREVKEAKKEGEEDKVTWKSGIHARDGGVIDFTRDNVMLTFQQLPDLFHDINGQAETAANFRKAGLEDDAKN